MSFCIPAVLINHWLGWCQAHHIHISSTVTGCPALYTNAFHPSVPVLSICLYRLLPSETYLSFHIYLSELFKLLFLSLSKTCFSVPEYLHIYK
jgi:hypothetical protein